MHCNNNNNKNNNVVDKYTKQVLDFLRNTSKENKEAEWDRISNLGLPNIGAFTFVEDAMCDIITRSNKNSFNFIDDGYCASYDSNNELDLAA